MHVRRHAARNIAVLTSTAILMAGLLAGPTVAADDSLAADGPTTLPANTFTLYADYAMSPNVVKALTERLHPVNVGAVMDNANLDRAALPPSFHLDGLADGFRFNDGDNSDCHNLPQGITTTRDAHGADYGGHQLILVSWYTRDDCDGGKATRSRITLVDWDKDYPNKYRQILLVQPSGTIKTPDFKDIPSHAGGAVWFGHYLYVADSGDGVRVFDMQKILPTNTGGTADQIGRQSDTLYYAHNYAYVLPQIGELTAAAFSPYPLVWSSISLDRATSSLVAAEYTCVDCKGFPNHAPRAVRFPIPTATEMFPLIEPSTEVLQLPWYHLNGVASHNGRWWFTSSARHTLYYFQPDAGCNGYEWVNGGESLSYWESSGDDLLWSLMESKDNRNVFAVRQETYTTGLRSCSGVT
jgi:hypothetical protein